MTLRQFFNRLARPAGKLSDLPDLRPESEYFGIERGQPIDRYYIEKFISKNQEKISGAVLEVAGNEYTQKYSTAQTRSFRLFTENISAEDVVVGDLTRKETLPKGRFNCFICTQTFNFIYELNAAVQGASYLLADGGWLLATVGGVSQISRYDMDRWGDYWRLSSKTCERIFSESFSEVSVVSFGNLPAAVAMLRGFSVEDLPQSGILDKQDLNYEVTIGIVARKL